MVGSKASVASSVMSEANRCIACFHNVPNGQSRLAEVCPFVESHGRVSFCGTCMRAAQTQDDSRCPLCRASFDANGNAVRFDSARLDRESNDSYELARRLREMDMRGEALPDPEPFSRSHSRAGTITPTPSVAPSTRSRHSSRREMSRNSARISVASMNASGVAGDRDRTPRASRAPSISTQSVSAPSIRSNRSHTSRRSQVQPPMSPVEPSMPALDRLSISNDIEPMPAPLSMAGIPMGSTPGSVADFSIGDSMDNTGEASGFGAELMQSGSYSNPHPEYAQSTHEFENDAMSVRTFSDPVPPRERGIGSRTNVSRTSVASRSSIRTMMSDLSTTSTRTTIVRDSETNQPMISRSKNGQGRKVSFAEKFAQYTLT